MMLARRARRRLRRWPSLGSGRVGVRVDGPRQPCPPGTAAARSVPVRAGHRGAERQEVAARRASIFKQVTETYTQSPFRPDAKLGVGDTYLGEGTAGSAGPGASTSSRSSSRSIPTHRARRLRAVQARHGALPPDARAAARSDARRATPIREFETFVDPLSEQHAAAGGRGAAARGARSAERGRVSRSAASTTGSAGIRAPIDRLDGAPEAGSRSTPGRDAVYFYPGRVARQGRAARPKRCPTSRSWSRNSSRASTSRKRASANRRS